MSRVSTSSPSGSSEGDRAQLQEKYGDTARHMYLNKEQVSAMVDDALHKSESVKFLLDALKQVIICYNKLKNYRDIELALTHELIHAYDHCRAANLDLTNCYHHACTEEFLRGNLSHAFIGQHKKCVRRRATMSVQMNPYCKGVKAEHAVNEVFSKCFQDTDPFDKTPGSS